MPATHNHHVSAVVLGGALIISSIIGSYAFYTVRSGNSLSTTGSAKERVKADTAKWTIRLERVVPDTAVGSTYALVAADANKVKKFFADNDIPSNAITLSPIAVEEYYSGINDGIRRVAVRQSVSVTSEDVDRVNIMSQSTVALAQQGVAFSPNMPEFYVSKLPELRVRLLGAAIQDAKKRADEIAGAMGQRVGKMQSASSGVVQVLAPNSIEVADYGQYDTASIEKDVMVTARGVFRLR
ncbi:MAG: SIMPL domain-containing protein [Parcubacteria group bacterium]|nr:SIMPL domain-containing protein [Parcubacteria group bacterium]